jgi:arylsulfatase A-like enzyme
VPAFSLLWLSEPDFSQHAAGPGSPKALAAIESSDRKLAEVLAELEKRGLRDKTDLFIVSDHGFSTVEKLVDVGKALRDAGFSVRRRFDAPPKKDDILIIREGGSVLFYVIGHKRETTRRLVNFLQQQDYAGVLFTREPAEGTFTLEEAHINSPHPPDVVLSLRWSAANSKIGVPGMLAADGSRGPGQGDHASLSRFDLHNTLVGAGPDLKKSFADTLPTGNTDLAPTILWLLGVKPGEPMDGRILSEALTIGAPPAGLATAKRLEAHHKIGNVVWHQYLQTSRVNQTIYLDEGNGYTTEK